MQVFGNSNSTKVNPSSNVGGLVIETKRVSFLPLGVHPARFYPLSSLFYKGADYFAIVQYFHWLNKQPVICRQNSFDHTVAEDAQKPVIDTHCIICIDKFAHYKKAKSLGFVSRAANNSEESKRFHTIGKDLTERMSAASLVSFVDKKTGELEPPVVLTYGKELFGRIEEAALRIEAEKGINICDPQKGYMFDIVVSMRENTDMRTYVNSGPSFGGDAIDITNASWKWDEICCAVKPEIKPIPTPDEVKAFYFNNYNGNEAKKTEYAHPSFNVNPGSGGQGVSVPGALPAAPLGAIDESLPKFVTPVIETSVEEIPVAAPSIHREVEAPAITPSPEVSNIVTPVKEVAPLDTGMYPCHSSLPNALGYDEIDAACKDCQHAKSCQGGKQKRGVRTAPSVQPAASASASASFANTAVGQAPSEDIQSKLAALKIQCKE